MSFGRVPTEIKVKDIASSPVITVSYNSKVADVARVMKNYKIGSVIVVDEKNEPIGIVTKSDIIERVLAEDKDPQTTKVTEIMSSPLISVNSETSVQDAAKLMRKKKISRLCVFYKGKLVGIISLRDIIRVAPELIDIITERTKITSRGIISPRRESIIGYCDGCGRWSDDLIEIDGKYYCRDCRIDYFGET